MNDPTNVTELDLVVGSLITTRPDEDRESFEEERDIIAEVQDQLREEGLDVDLLSQPGVEVWEGGIETIGALYQLSRIAVHLERDGEIDAVLADGPNLAEDLDPFVTDVWDDQFATRFPHLIKLQGINSYYLPIDFSDPIWMPFETDEDDEEEAFFGSSVRLQRELTELAAMMKSARVPTNNTAYRCFETLRDAAEQSVTNGLPIIVW